MAHFLNQLPQGKYSYSPKTEWDFTELNKSLSNMVNQAMQSQQIQQDRQMLRRVLGQDAESIMGPQPQAPASLSGRVMQGMGQMFGVGQQNQPISDIQKAVIEAKMKQMWQEWKPQTQEQALDFARATAGIKSNITDPAGLTSEQQLQARALARKIYGVRGAQFGLPNVYEEMRKGKNIDEIEDSLRYAGQSKEFSGDVRNAMQNITVGWSTDKKQIAFDEVDDYKSEPEVQKQAIKRTALKAGTSDQQNQVMGKERTVDLLNEISDSLETLERNGTPTNWMTGNIEGLMGRVGLVKNPAMREVATKIAVAVMAYRRSMTGVQFGMIENKEYKRIFPNIDKVNAFNTATAKALKSTFKGDTDKFYSQSMGEYNYNQLFGNTMNNEKQNQRIKVKSPNGQIGTIPEKQLKDALSQGYIQAQ